MLKIKVQNEIERQILNAGVSSDAIFNSAMEMLTKKVKQGEISPAAVGMLAGCIGVFKVTPVSPDVEPTHLPVIAKRYVDSLTEAMSIIHVLHNGELS